MGVFDDKRYNELDWVSQAVQPIETPLAALLEKLPDRVSISYVALTNWSASGDISKDTIVNSIVRTHENQSNLSWREREIINGCFELECSSELILNMEDRTLTGEIYLVKTKFTLDDDVLKKTMGEQGREYLGRIRGYDMNVVRANEMLDLLEKCESALASRSGKIKRQALLNRTAQILTEGEWRIKSTDLANKVSIWIKNYIDTGDLSALSNITRLKVMTYKDGPIYSIEETQC